MEAHRYESAAIRREMIEDTMMMKDKRVCRRSAETERRSAGKQAISVSHRRVFAETQEVNLYQYAIRPIDICTRPF